jgi:probable addiction module antidote protein
MTRKDLKRYDVADFLRDDEDVIAYLNAAFDDGHPEVIAHAIGNVARMRGMSRVAKACGLGRESLYKSLSDRGNPEFGTILGVLRAMGVRLRVEACPESSPSRMQGRDGRRARPALRKR